VKDKTLRLVNTFWHILPKEPSNEAVLSEVLSWMNARLAPRPAPVKALAAAAR
jgi:hypothetical protein